MESVALSGGFDDPARDGSFAFRAIMRAMARPGTIQTLSVSGAPASISPAAAAVLLTLVDGDTSLALLGGYDDASLRAWLAFHTGVPIVGPEKARFVLGCRADMQPISRFSIGTPEYPDTSATLIVECDELRASGARLTGPGIKDEARLNLPEIEIFQQNRARFPLGLDFLFTCDATMAALPRSTEVRLCT